MQGYISRGKLIIVLIEPSKLPEVRRQVDSDCKKCLCMRAILANMTSY